MYIGAEGYRNTPQVQVAGKQPSQPKHVGISNSSSTFKINREKSVNMRKRICSIIRFAPILLLAALFVPPAASAQETGKEAAKETPAYPIKPVRARGNGRIPSADSGRQSAFFSQHGRRIDRDGKGQPRHVSVCFGRQWLAKSSGGRTL